MKKVVVTVLVCLFSMSSMANGIVCSVDARPNGGDLRELMLVSGSDGAFVMKHKMETGWFSAGSTIDEAAAGLVCNISTKEEIAYCEATAADGTKTIAKIEQVKRSGLTSLEENSMLYERVVEATVKQGNESKVKMYRFPAKSCKLLKDGPAA